MAADDGNSGRTSWAIATRLLLIGNLVKAVSENQQSDRFGVVPALRGVSLKHHAHCCKRDHSDDESLPLSSKVGVTGTDTPYVSKRSSSSSSSLIPYISSYTKYSPIYWKGITSSLYLSD